MIIVFYDGKCSLCAKEIAHYQKIAPNHIFNWQDITQSTDMLEDYNINLIDALKEIHVINHDGKLSIGVDAFIVIWYELKNWHILAKIVKQPLVYSITRFLYQKFAIWRFKRLAHCKILINSDE